MAALLGAFTTSCGDDDDSPGFRNGDTVTLRTPGTLSQMLGDAVRTVTTLKVNGPINGDDIICLRRMAGCTDEDADSCGVLSVLDLSNATMTAGGASYSRNYYTTTGRIGDYMFYRCDGLTSLQLPSGTTTIGSFAFADCQNLMSTTVPEGVTSIGEAAWYNCPSLTALTLPAGIGELARGAMLVAYLLHHPRGRHHHRHLRLLPVHGAHLRHHPRGSEDDKHLRLLPLLGANQCHHPPKRHLSGQRGLLGVQRVDGTDPRARRHLDRWLGVLELHVVDPHPLPEPQPAFVRQLRLRLRAHG